MIFPTHLVLTADLGVWQGVFLQLIYSTSKSPLFWVFILSQYMGLSFHLVEVSVLDMKKNWRNQVTYQRWSVLNPVKNPAIFDLLMA